MEKEPNDESGIQNQESFVKLDYDNIKIPKQKQKKKIRCGLLVSAYSFQTRRPEFNTAPVQSFDS